MLVVVGEWPPTRERELELEQSTLYGAQTAHLGTGCCVTVVWMQYHCLCGVRCLLAACIISPSHPGQRPRKFPNHTPSCHPPTHPVSSTSRHKHGYATHSLTPLDHVIAVLCLLRRTWAVPLTIPLPLLFNDGCWGCHLGCHAQRHAKVLACPCVPPSLPPSSKGDGVCLPYQVCGQRLPPRQELARLDPAAARRSGPCDV